MAEQITIEVENITLEVEYYYDEGMKSNDRDIPDDDISIDIQSIKVKGVDTYDILASWVFDKIKEKIYETNN